MSQTIWERAVTYFAIALPHSISYSLIPTLSHICFTPKKRCMLKPTKISVCIALLDKYIRNIFTTNKGKAVF